MEENNYIEDTKNKFEESNEPMNPLGKWSRFFVERFRVVFLIILIISILGISAYINLSRELQPEVTFPFGNVFTMYSGASPEEVETLITDKVEKSLSDLDDVKSITSYSGFGYSNVFVEFEQGVDMEKKIQKIQENVSSIENELPDDAETPHINDFETNNSPILIINITGDMDLVRLKSIAEDISDRLELEKDVKSTLIVGGLEREIDIIVDPNLLYNYGISVNQIKNALSASNINFPGGNIILDKKRYNLRTIGEFKNVDEIGEVILKYNGSTPIKLKDISLIKDGYKEIKSYSRTSMDINTDEAKSQNSISIAVKKKTSADVIKTSSLIHNIIENEKGTLYPDNLSVYISGDTAKYVEDQLGSVTENAISGLFIVLIVLFLFIGFKEAVIVSTVIPLAILSTLLLLKISDMTLNTITLFSIVLAVGMLVDNGIVIMENIDRLRHKGYNSKDASIIGTNQIAPAVFSSMLTTIAAFFPIALTSGIMGAFIKPIPITVIYALVSSFFMAITITPALCAIILKKSKTDNISENPRFKKFKSISSIIFIAILSLLAFRTDGQIGILSAVFAIIFSSMMLFRQIKGNTKPEDIKFIKTYSDKLYNIITSKKKRRIAIGLTFVAFLLSLSLPITGLLKINMFTAGDAERIYIDINTPVGTTLDITNELVTKVETHLLHVPEIKSFTSNVGITGADSFQLDMESSGDPTIARIIVDLKLPEERDRTSQEISSDLQQKLKGIAGGEIQLTGMAGGPPSEPAIQIEIIGKNLDDMAKVTKYYENVLKSFKGTKKISSTLSNGDMELQIVIDKLKAARYGISDIQIAGAVRNAVMGIEATTITKNGDDIKVMIKTSNDKLNKKSDLDNIYVQSMSGQLVPLSNVADISEQEGINSINHEDLKRHMTVSSELNEGYNATEVTNEFKEKVSSYKLPDGIKVSYGGEVQDVKETFTEMFRNMIVAIILVYLILAVQFNSLSQPTIILFTVPMAIIGVMPGLVVTGNAFGFVAFVGVVSLVGIAVNDAIVLVDYINYLRKNGYELYDAVKETGIARFIPVMATTITTAGGILPLSIKEEFFQPLGVALIFGLLTATVLTLVIIPTMYTILEERKINKQQKPSKRLKLLKLLGGKSNE